MSNTRWQNIYPQLTNKLWHIHHWRSRQIRQPSTISSKVCSMNMENMFTSVEGNTVTYIDPSTNSSSEFLKMPHPSWTLLNGQRVTENGSRVLHNECKYLASSHLSISADVHWRMRSFSTNTGNFIGVFIPSLSLPEWCHWILEEEDSSLMLVESEQRYTSN